MISDESLKFNNRREEAFWVEMMLILARQHNPIMTDISNADMAVAALRDRRPGNTRPTI